MSWKRLLAAACVTVVLVIQVTAAQKRPHNEIMSEVNATYEKLKMSLDDRNAAEATAGAAKLQDLFKETEDFWTRFETKDAIDAAKAAQAAFAALESSIKVNNFQQALTTYTAAARNCAACHSTHRVQMADQTYRIKP